MKVLSLLLLFLIAISSVAQTTQPPDLSILSYKWKRYHRPQIPPESDDPFTGSDPQKDWAQNPSQVVRANAPRERAEKAPITSVRSTTANTSGVDDASQSALALNRHPTAAPSSVEYSYEVTVGNTGTKRIRRVDWMYVFFDESSKRAMGVHRFASVVNLSAGKSKKVVGRSASPPTRIVHASKPGAITAGHYAESVVVERIEYADGSIWQRVTQ